MSMKRGVPEADVRIRAARHVWLPILLMGCFFLALAAPAWVDSHRSELSPMIFGRVFVGEASCGHWWLGHRGEAWRPVRPEAPSLPVQT